ncbi:MAG: single-stranded-DNA-specific exonuclease RecJ, partial [Phycisphaerae bacterium]|nr:single-stranded-DNA-specific exonuclease RecJ [Phycisphaerae bacterium]
MAKEWIYKPKVETGSIDAARLNIPQLLARILANRSLTDEAAAKAFLKPKLAHLHDPSLLPDIDKAVGRIIQAVKGGEPIVIYGDYDVDGIAGSAILHHTLGMLGAGDVPVYVPHRLEEGYGVNADALRLLAKRGTRLVITVDCGITSIEEAAVARELGMDLIITDHHEPSPAGLPDAVALVNPKAPHSTYPFRSLSGSGVAFKVAWALGQELSPTRRVSPEFKEFLISATALAALGTVADVVPLVDENRALTHFGLRALSASSQPGIVALMETAGCSNREMKAGHIAFGLAPRLNAAGRMGHAQDAVDLLTTTDPAVATRLAGLLEEQNVLRQKTEKRIAEEAIEKVDREVNLETDRIIVLAEEGWHPGVIGIVASRVLERFGRPAVLIALTDGRGQGSARSIPGFSIFDAIADSADLLTS